MYAWANAKGLPLVPILTVFVPTAATANTLMLPLRHAALRGRESYKTALDGLDSTRRFSAGFSKSIRLKAEECMITSKTYIHHL